MKVLQWIALRYRSHGRVAYRSQRTLFLAHKAACFALARRKCSRGIGRLPGNIREAATDKKRLPRVAKPLAPQRLPGTAPQYCWETCLLAHGDSSRLRVKSTLVRYAFNRLPWHRSRNSVAILRRTIRSWKTKRNEANLIMK